MHISKYLCYYTVMRFYIMIYYNKKLQSKIGYGLNLPELQAFMIA